MKRVVVTGLGLVSPLGCGNDLVWDRLLRGESGVRSLTATDGYKNLPVRIGAQVPIGNKIGEFDETAVYGRDVSKEVPRFVLYAALASDIALEHAGIGKQHGYALNPCRSGVAIGTGIGAISDILEGAGALNSSYKRLRYILAHNYVEFFPFFNYRLFYSVLH